MADALTKNALSTLSPLAGASVAKQAALVVGGSIALAILSQISVPFVPVPLTLQTLGVLLIGLTFGFRLATATLVLYIVEGAVGLPVFANGASGYAVLMGPTGGYLIGFLLSAMLISFLADKGETATWTGMIGAVFMGEVILMGLGYSQLAYFLGAEKAAVLGVYPFVLGDLIKMALAVLLAKGVLKGASRFASL